MPKKKEFDEESEDDFLENESENLDDYTPDEELGESNDEIVVVPDDEDNIDIVIEVSDDDFSEEESVDKSTEETDGVVLSKHKIQGKHSLKYDSIFKGKKEEVSEEDEVNNDNNIIMSLLNDYENKYKKIMIKYIIHI